MNIRNENPDLLTVGWVAGPLRPGEPSTTFVVKATYELVPGGVARVRAGAPPEVPCGDLFEDDDAALPLRYSNDFALFKPRADVLVTGAVYAPGGKATMCDATMQVGALMKSIVVVGDRKWEGGGLLRGKKPSAPLHFERVPLSYRLAHGGPDFGQNPVGRGRHGDELPNFELPGRLLTSQKEKTPPAGFGPLAPDWEPRSKLVGTYHDKWAAERWPAPPRDFDFAHHNAAPRDQQVEGYLRGDEPLRFLNLHPDHPDLVTELPGLRARCFLNRAVDGHETFTEVALSCDTLWVDVDAMTAVVVWRGRAPVRSAQMTDVLDVFVCAEPLATAEGIPQTYRERMERLSAEEVEPEEDEVDDGPTIEAQMAAMELEFDASRAEFAEMDAASAEVETAALAELTAAGHGTADEILGRKVDFVAEMQAQIAAATDPEARARMESQLGEFQQAEADVAAIEQRFDELEAEGEPDPEPLTRDDVVARLAASASLAGTELSGLDLSELDFTGVDLSGAELEGTNLQRANLTQAKLQDTLLAGADLTDAVLSGADLSRSDADGAKFGPGAKLSGVRLDDAVLTGVDLTGADLSDAAGERADLSGSVLSGASLARAALPRVDLIGCDLTGADCSAADLTNADLHEAKAAGAKFIRATLAEVRASLGADFRGCDFTGAQGRDSVWEACHLDDAIFDEASFELAQWTGSTMTGVRANRIDLRSGVFDDCDLSRATLIQSNLLRASFVGARLDQTDLRGANLFEAGFVDADVATADLDTARLGRTLLEKRR